MGLKKERIIDMVLLISRWVHENLLLLLTKDFQHI